ncbi:hypothetical protein V8F20_001380 [Naviculisporaceae sp. PSN 640]
MATESGTVDCVIINDDETPPPAAPLQMSEPAPSEPEDIQNNPREVIEIASSHGSPEPPSISSEDLQLDPSQPVFVAGEEQQREVIVIADDTNTAPDASIVPPRTGVRGVVPPSLGSAATNAILISDSDSEDEQENDTSDGPQDCEIVGTNLASDNPAVVAIGNGSNVDAVVPSIEQDDHEESPVSHAPSRKRKRDPSSGIESNDIGTNGSDNDYYDDDDDDDDDDEDDHDDDDDDGSENEAASEPQEDTDGRQDKAKRQKRDHDETGNNSQNSPEGTEGSGGNEGQGEA